ncbi:MAG: hypothetical protein U0Y10_08010 [Spirosomataceae bacterium]
MESSPNELNTESLQNYLNTPELLRDLLEQLVKDFKMANLTLSLDLSMAYSFDQLQAKVEETLRQQATTPRSVQAVLYRVDLSEGQLKKRLNSDAKMTQLAELIIKRELQKVVIRHWYRKVDGGV